MHVKRPGCSRNPSIVKLATRQRSPYRHGFISPLISTCGSAATVVVVDPWVVADAEGTVVVGGPALGLAVATESVGADVPATLSCWEGSSPEPASQRHVTTVTDAMTMTATRPHQLTVHCDEAPSGDTVN